MIFKKAQREYISNFENELHTALYADWSRNIPSYKLDNLVEIYEDATGNEYKFCRHCGASVLKFLKELAKLYYADIEEINKKQDKINNK